MRIISTFMLVLALFVIGGCSQKTVEMPDTVVIERINVEDDTYEVIKTVTDKKEISDIYPTGGKYKLGIWANASKYGTTSRF